MNIVFYTFIHYVYEQGLVYKCVLLRHITKYLGPLVWESIKPEMERFEKARPRWAHMWSVLITQLRNQPLHRTVSPHSSNMAMKRPRSGQDLTEADIINLLERYDSDGIFFGKMAIKPPKIKILQKKFIGVIKSPIDMIWYHFWYGSWGGASEAPPPPHNVNKTCRPTRG